MKILTGFAVLKDSTGNRISYTYSIVNEKGDVVASNKKESYVVLNKDINELVKQLEEKITEERLKD